MFEIRRAEDDRQLALFVNTRVVRWSVISIGWSRARTLGRSLGALRDSKAALRVLVGTSCCRDMFTLRWLLGVGDDECLVMATASCGAYILVMQPGWVAQQVVEPRGSSFQVRPTATVGSSQQQPAAAAGSQPSRQPQPATAAAGNSQPATAGSRSSQPATQPMTGHRRLGHPQRRGGCHFQARRPSSWGADPGLSRRLSASTGTREPGFVTKCVTADVIMSGRVTVPITKQCNRAGLCNMHCHQLRRGAVSSIVGITSCAVEPGVVTTWIKVHIRHAWRHGAGVVLTRRAMSSPEPGVRTYYIGCGATEPVSKPWRSPMCLSSCWPGVYRCWRHRPGCCRHGYHPHDQQAW